MKIRLFCHSLMSGWNHGNVHFLRGVVGELGERGHDVEVFEPEDAWSVQRLMKERGESVLADFHKAFPNLRSTRYDAGTLDLEATVDGADLVLVHEWNEPALVADLGRLRRAGGSFKLLFHDTHHRAVTAPDQISGYELDAYDGVLAFGRVIRDLYLDNGWAERAWTWHEAADTRIFHPLPEIAQEGDVVWTGNWGDDERTEELDEFLFHPVQELGLTGSVYGVGYSEEAQAAVAAAGLTFRGWLPNQEVPLVFARHAVTVHIPRRPYARMLPGIPTIRVFEALACGIPLVSSPWEDSEGLFTGEDMLIAGNGEEMKRHLKDVINDPELAGGLARSGLETILARHTCAHRVDELLAICIELGIANDEEQERVD